MGVWLILAGVAVAWLGTVFLPTDGRSPMPKGPCIAIVFGAILVLLGLVLLATAADAHTIDRPARSLCPVNGFVTSEKIIASQACYWRTHGTRDQRRLYPSDDAR